MSWMTLVGVPSCRAMVRLLRRLGGCGLAEQVDDAVTPFLEAVQSEVEGEARRQAEAAGPKLEHFLAEIVERVAFPAGCQRPRIAVWTMPGREAQPPWVMDVA